MPGSLADLLYLGQPDPSRQIAAMLSGQQPQGAPPQGAGPQGPQPPTAPNGPAPTQNPAPGQPPPPGSPPSPMAYQSSPDMAASYNALANPPNLMSLYLQLQARQSASDQINKGFALIAANHAGNPEMARAIMGSVGGGADAGQTVNNLMSIYGAQQSMAAQQQMLAQAPAIAAKLGIDEGTVRAEILAGRGPDLVKSMEPTDVARNYQWARDTYAKNHPGASPDDIEEGAQSILLSGMGSGGDADTRSWRAAKVQWDMNPATKGTPYPWGTGADDTPTRFRAWSSSQVEQDKQTQADQGEAAKMGPTYRGNLQGVRDKIAGIIGIQPDGSIDPAREAQLKTLLGTSMAQKFINAEPTKGSGSWEQGLATWWGGLKPEDQALLTQIRDATNPNTRIGGLYKPPKRGVSDVNDIGAGLDGMRNATQGYDDWMTGAKNTLKSIDTATMNSFGAQGTPEAAEDYARKHGLPVDEALPLMDDNYLSGGAMYPKGKALGTMAQPQISAATAAIKNAADPEAERQKQIKLALIRNTDPTPLKNLKV